MRASNPGFDDARGAQGDTPTTSTTQPASPTDAAVAEAEKATRVVVPRLAIGVGVVAMLMVGLGLLAELVQDQEVNALDTFASPFVHRFASPVLDAVMTGASTIGSVPVLLAISVLAAAVAWSRGRPWLAALVVVAAAGAILLNEALKTVVHRPRPRLEWAAVYPDYSFPSGHTMDSIVVLVAVALVAWALLGRRLGMVATVGAVLLALLIGLSRIYLGAHYLTDVVGGYLAGAAWLFIVVWAFGAAQRRRGRRRESRRGTDDPVAGA